MVFNTNKEKGNSGLGIAAIQKSWHNQNKVVQ